MSHKIQCFEVLREYFANCAHVSSLTDRVRRFPECRCVADVDRKIDLQMKLRQLRKACRDFNQKYLFDFTQREIDFLRRKYYKRESVEEIARSYGYSTAKTEDFGDKLYRRLRYLSRSDSKWKEETA